MQRNGFLAQIIPACGAGRRRKMAEKTEGNNGSVVRKVIRDDGKPRATRESREAEDARVWRANLRGTPGAAGRTKGNDFPNSGSSSKKWGSD